VLEHAVARQLADGRQAAADGLKAVMRAICETEDWGAAARYLGRGAAVCCTST